LFDTKIAIVLLKSLETWQKLNVTSFLTSGIIGETPQLIGKTYKDKSNYQYLPLNSEPAIILESDSATLKKIHSRICNRSLRCSIYITDMFSSGHDQANRETVSRYSTEELPIVGLAIREEKKIVDKISKGAQLHS
tara:strand:+ start:103 stop:510 length:408 start_codon:yes stop_codon:yes gene_type:complete